MTANPDDLDSLAGPIDDDPEEHDLDDADLADLDAAEDRPLDFDELLAEGQLVERVSSIYTNGRLYGLYEECVRELSTLVDEDGNVIDDGEESLGEGARAQELADKAHRLKAQLERSRRTVRFRAMDADEWPVFDRQHRPGGKFKTQAAADEFNRQIIARCAIEPELTVEQVDQLRKKLTPSQYTKLANDAFWACVTGGVDLPKSPAFSPNQRPGISGPS